MTDWPTIAEELSRKAIETLHQSVHDHDQGELSVRELRLVLNAIVDTTQGLVPHETIDLILQVRKELK